MMQETKIAVVNGREVPVLISDEKEALLAAKAAGRAIIGLWRPGQEMDEISAARYVVEDPQDATEEYLERVARRHLGLPWKICETERLVIREMFADDFDAVAEGDHRRFSFVAHQIVCADTDDQFVTHAFCVAQKVQVTDMKQVKHTCSIANNFILHILYPLCFFLKKPIATVFK